MKLSYFDLLSPMPIYVPMIGGVKSPTLREISQVTYPAYQLYLSVLLMTPKTYYDTIGQEEAYQAFSDEERQNLSVMHLLTQEPNTRKLLEEALQFFTDGTFVYDEPSLSFLIFHGQKDEQGRPVPTGILSQEMWPKLCNIILQRNYIQTRNEDLSKVKSKKAQAILKKLQEGRANRRKNAGEDQNLELGNIISAVAAKSNTLNIENIWDITVYQLWDSFHRLCSNHVLDIQSMSVAAWGDKDKRYDASAWFKNPNNQ